LGGGRELLTAEKKLWRKSVGMVENCGKPKKTRWSANGHRSSPTTQSRRDLSRYTGQLDRSLGTRGVRRSFFWNEGGDIKTDKIHAVVTESRSALTGMGST